MNPPGNWRARLAGHAHRFRDTFAVELLLASVPLERVSVLLWTPKREDHRAALFAVGALTPGATRTGFAARMEPRPGCSHANEGYT